MELQQAIDDGMPLMIAVPYGGDRPIAELFIVGDGIVFADIGWFDSPAHPFHRVEGTIAQGDGDYIWTVGDAVIQRIGPGLAPYEELMRWRDWRKTAGGKHATRELAREAIWAQGLDRRA